MNKFFITAALVVAALGTACAQSVVTLRVNGAKQGLFTGDSQLKGPAGQMSVLYFDHQIVSPRDPASGLPTGKRVHSPLVIRKQVLGQSWIQFHQALSTNETLRTVFLDISTYTDGLLELVSTVRLDNASVASIEDVFVPGSPATMASAAVIAHHEMIISFAYQKIEWTWRPTGAVTSDNWDTRLGLRIGSAVSHYAMR